jgi:hypothetical protein
MSRLMFDLAALRPIVEHALSASEHAPVFGQTPPIAPALWLVKDDGIYLMSNGRPRQIADDSFPNDQDQHGQSLVVYAEGFDPTKADSTAVWYAARDAVGGDDFGEPLPAEWFKDALDRGASTITLNVTNRAIHVVLPITTT